MIKKIETKIQEYKPLDHICVFNESFQMKTTLDWIPEKKQFKKKRSDLQVHQIINEEMMDQDVMNAVLSGKTKLLGNAQLDLAQAANKTKV